ncbi:hypothetical protein OG440_38425 (plasmid) [Streptomyces sp. NBC_00637]|uniref:hypothetical protein n=1 Tax=Streptomyces sp. NBC_00637 TaxID=2903667 RepID=UPI00324CEC76
MTRHTEQQQEAARPRTTIALVVIGVLALLGAFGARAAGNDVLAYAGMGVTLGCTVWLAVDAARRWQKDRPHRP